MDPFLIEKNVLRALELHAPCCGATVRQVCQCPIPCTDSRLSFEEEGEPCLPSLSATACHEPILRWITCLGSTCPIARYLLRAGLAASADTSHTRRPKARPRSCACGRKQMASPWQHHTVADKISQKKTGKRRSTKIRVAGPFSRKPGYAIGHFSGPISGFQKRPKNGA